VVLRSAEALEVSIVQLFRIAIGVALAALLSWILFRDTDWSEIGAAITRAKFSWLLLSPLFLVLSHFARAQRWTYIVRAARPASFRSIFSATQIGLLSNFALPMRLGEVVRVFVLGRLTNTPFSEGAALSALDKLGDVICLLIILVVVALAFPVGRHIEFPPGTFDNQDPLILSGAFLRFGMIGSAVFVFVILLLMAALYSKRSLVIRGSDLLLAPASPRLALRVRNVLIDLATGMRILGSTIDMAKSISFSMLAWILSQGSLMVIMIAFSLDVPWYTPLLMQAMIVTFILVPLTPGLIGQFHIAVVAALLIAAPQVTMAEAKATALISHFLALATIAGLGGFCLFWERLSISEITRESVARRQSEGSD
jgi:uncharacterized protein (TIRG00374 family)